MKCASLLLLLAASMFGQDLSGTYTGTLAEGQLAVQTVFLVPSPGAYAYSFDVAKDTMVSFGTAYADNATVFARYTPFGPSGLLPSEVATAEQGAALPVIPARDQPPADPALYPKP